MKLEHASALTVYRAARFGARGLYYADPLSGLRAESPVVSLLRVADAYSGDWEDGVYARIGAAAIEAATVPDAPTSLLLPAFLAGVRVAGKKLLPNTNNTTIDEHTPIWGLAELFSAHEDSHARALGGYLAALSKRHANVPYLLEWSGMSLGLFANTQGNGDAIADAIHAINQYVNTYKESLNVQAA